jgi:hypothetical protein
MCFGLRPPRVKASWRANDWRNYRGHRPARARGPGSPRAGRKRPMAALSAYRDDELALLLDFLGRARSASLAAMVELRALSVPRPKPRLSGRSNKHR